MRGHKRTTTLQAAHNTPGLCHPQAQGCVRMADDHRRRRPPAQSDGGLQLALFRVEALVAVPLHAEKLNMLPGLGALLVLGTIRSDGTACTAPPCQVQAENQPPWTHPPPRPK